MHSCGSADYFRQVRRKQLNSKPDFCSCACNTSEEWHFAGKYIGNWNGVGKPLSEVERANFVSCNDIMASFFLEMNDIWNIHNMNIWHFSWFMNPKLEILFCFLGRLEEVSDIGKSPWQQCSAWFLNVSWKNWICPPALRLSGLDTWARFSYTDLQCTKGKCLRANAARDGSSTWHCTLLASWSWASIRLEFEVKLQNDLTLNHPILSVTKPKRYVF